MSGFLTCAVCLRKVSRLTNKMCAECSALYGASLKNVGRKDDIVNGVAKPRFDLVPPFFEEVVKALTYGANKYGDANWQKVPNGRRRYFAALMRHSWAGFRGEVRDEESGLSHWAHAGACILFLGSELTGDADCSVEHPAP